MNSLEQLAADNAPEPKPWWESLTREELIHEVWYLRRRVAQLEKIETEYNWIKNPDRMGQ